MTFSTSYADILKKIDTIDPIKYGYTRNYLTGSVTYLSPYISRGIISTKQVKDTLLQKGFPHQKIEKFLQELAWRDYWQQIWISKKEHINTDLKNKQTKVSYHDGMPTSILEASTGIEAIDKAIKEFYSTGYLHNHLRMYLASIICNVGQYAWQKPAQWMYYHLLDADWASNALSWQWVCGANSNKLYYANQENINKYCNSHQKNTFLDVSYEELAQADIPNKLQRQSNELLFTTLPSSDNVLIDNNIPTIIYNFYNLDPNWKQDINANRILLLEPSIFEKYPVSEKSIDFCIQFSKENIPNVQVMVAEFNDLQTKVKNTIFFKEHPLNKYLGIEEPRDWMFNVKGAYSSFFGFWKKCQKEL